MELTANTKREARACKLTVENMAFVDLVALGWDAADAYITVFKKGAAFSKPALNREAEKILASDGAKARMKALMQKKADMNFESDHFDVSDISKESTLKELMLAKQKFGAGSKEWLDIQKQIIEVSQMKKEEIKSEDTTVHFYLPLKCNVCELYVKWLKNRDKNQTKEDEE